MREPIVVLGTPRSGTSLVCGILAAHGVWTGDCREPEPINPKGFFENIALDDLRVKDALSRNNVAAVLRSEGYTGGPWLAKHTPRYAETWRAFDPVWVVVRRNPESVLVSRKAYFEETEDHARDVIATDNRLLNGIEGVNVWPEKFVSGDFFGILPVLNQVGIAFDPNLANNFMEPRLWHH